jgi:taurine dioxygenase
MGITINPLSAVGGADVTRLDLTQPMNTASKQALNDALSQHGWLCVRAQPLAAREIADFARAFGHIQPHVQRAYQHPEVPEIVMMTNRKADGSFDNAGARRGAAEQTREGWHSDLTYDPVPAKATILHAVEIPSLGGNTCFANAALAYARLDPSLKERLNGLRAAFVYGGHQRNASTRAAASALDAQAQKTAHAVHPVVNRHPVTGQPGIYVNPLLTTHIIGVNAAESDALLEVLCDALDDETIRSEHQWQVGDTLIWDNRGGIMHTGRLDYPRDEARRFMRATVTGAVMVGHRHQAA